MRYLLKMHLHLHREWDWFLQFQGQPQLTNLPVRLHHLQYTHPERLHNKEDQKGVHGFPWEAGVEKISLVN